MTPSSFPYSYLCIEGNLGAGKTTLARKLSNTHDMHCILEQFTDNPFLPHFYKNPERYAFPVELFFLTERHKQLEEQLIERDLFSSSVVADYFFPKTLLFARNNLDDSEFHLFQRMYDVLIQRIPNPDLLIYLHRSVDRLYEMIHSRNRSIESSIDKNYLKGIQDSYFTFFRSSPDYPIVILDVENIDFEQIEDHFNWIEELIREPFSPGVHRIRWMPDTNR